MKTVVSTLFLALATCSAHAGFISGNSLHDSLLALERFQAGRSSSSDGNEVIKTTGYLMGVADSWNGVAFCTTSGVTVGQIASIAKKYLDENPQLWHEPAAYLVVTALSHALPCPTKK